MREIIGKLLWEFGDFIQWFSWNLRGDREGYRTSRWGGF